MAKDSVSWSDSKAGYEPGQRQSLTVSYVKREQHKVTLKVSFSAHSLGLDSYTASQRWNHAYVYVYRKKDNGQRGTLLHTHDWTYQIHGNGGSSSHSTSFSFGGVDYGETKLIICYENKRVGTNTPWYGPKSTGKVDFTQLNELLDIDDAKKVKINYKPGGLSEDKVKNLPKDKEIYAGKDFTVSSNILEHEHYDFRYGYDTSDEWKKKKDGSERSVNTTEPKVKSGKVIKNVSSDIDLYACWEPKTFIYRYYPTESDAKKRTNEYEDLRQTRKYKKPGVLTPDLSETKYNKLGYKFLGWKHTMPEEKSDAYHKMDVDDPNAVNHRECRRNADTYCWPVWEGVESTIIFDFGYYISDSEGSITKYTRTVNNYLYGTDYDVSNMCVDKDGIKKSQILVRPGYKLIGWSFTEPEKIYNFGEAKPGDYNFTYDYIGSVTPVNMSTDEFRENGITLYAVWEYFTFMYVYTNNRWRLVVPYVAVNDPTKTTYGYDSEVEDRVIERDYIRWKSVIPSVYSHEDWRLPGRSIEENPDPEPPVPIDEEVYVSYDSDSKYLTFFTDEIGKYEDGQEEGSVTYYLGAEDTRERIPWDRFRENIEKVIVKNSFGPFWIEDWFTDCVSLVSIEGFDKIDFSITMNANNLFKGCSSLTSIDLSGISFDIMKIFGSMFEDCTALESVDMTNVKMPYAEDLSSMFANCTSLTDLKMNFETPCVQNMNSMFKNCSSLINLDISTFITNQVTDMGEMFSGCSKLRDINNNEKGNIHRAYFTNFKTPEVKNMESMFKDCESLNILDLSSFNTKSVVNFDSMFENCSNLLSIYSKRSNKNTKKEYDGQFKKDSLQSSTDMFLGCTSLIGISKGVEKLEYKVNNKTKDKSSYIKKSDYYFTCEYDPEKVDAEYASVAWVFTKNMEKHTESSGEGAENDYKPNFKLDKEGKKTVEAKRVKVFKKSAKGETLVEKKDFKPSATKDIEAYENKWKDKKNYRVQTVNVYAKLTSNELENKLGYFTEI